MIVIYLIDVFKHFERKGEFFCFAGQTTQAVTGMFNLYRASEVSFPGEKILEDAKQFSAKFLREKQAANRLVDKWIIMKNLPEEVRININVIILNCDHNYIVINKIINKYNNI